MSDVPIQNFTIPADADEDVTFLIASTIDNDTLVGSTIYFRAYEQSYGMIVSGAEPVLQKSSEDSAIELVGSGITMAFVVHFTSEDTVDKLRNYYYEVTVVDEVGDKEPVVRGIMTIDQTENRIT